MRRQGCNVLQKRLDTLIMRVGNKCVTRSAHRLWVASHLHALRCMAKQRCCSIRMRSRTQTGETLRLQVPPQQTTTAALNVLCESFAFPFRFLRYFRFLRIYFALVDFAALGHAALCVPIPGPGSSPSDGRSLRNSTVSVADLMCL